MSDEHARRVRWLSTINGALGVWLVVSPSLLGTLAPVVAWSGIIAGLLVLLCAAIRFTSRDSAVISWANVVLGVWVALIPWINGHVGVDLRTWNYTIVGILIAGIEGLSLTSSAIRHPWTPGERTSPTGAGARRPR